MLLVLCVGNLSVIGEYSSHRPVSRSFDIFFDLRLNKRTNKQSRHKWFDTSSRSLWRHCKVFTLTSAIILPKASNFDKSVCISWSTQNPPPCSQINARNISHNKWIYQSYKTRKDDVVSKWKLLPRYRTFVRGIHRSPVNSSLKGAVKRALMILWCGPA